jgi:hypothetical protein
MAALLPGVPLSAIFDQIGSGFDLLDSFPSVAQLQYLIK